MATLDDLIRALSRPPERLPADRGMAAVAAVFTPDLDLLLIRRAEHPGDPWSGHVSFPGGRVEPTDRDTRAAAARETWEEVGLSLDRAVPLGELDDLAAVGGRPGLIIRPHVFLIDGPLPELRPNGEVASTHALRLERLLADEGRGPMDWTWSGRSITLPRVDFDGQRLWGLTLRMVDDLLHRIDGRGVGLARMRDRSVE